MSGRFARDDEVDGVARRRLGADRGSRRYRRDRCRGRRPPVRVPDAGEVPRRPRPRTARPAAATPTCGAAIPRCRRPGRRSAPSSTGSAASSPSTAVACSRGCACTPRSSTSWSAPSAPPTCACTRRRSSAKYAGDANFEQPMHTDRNHSFLPPRMEAALVARRVVPVSDRRRRGNRADPSRPASGLGRALDELDLHARGDPELYAARTRRRRSARFVARVPSRRLPPRRRPHPARESPVTS